MLKLTIDRGNSSTKFGLFDKDTLIFVDSASGHDKSKISILLNEYQPEAVIVSSVVEDDDFSWLKTKVPSFLTLDQHTNLPFNNLYKSPETLGKDRIAAVAGASALYPGSSLLVIDAGTAITYDLFLADNTYSGGDISPGLEMRFKALNAFTSKLPLVSCQEGVSFPGQKTTDAIASGVINGMIFEIEGYRDYCSKKWGSVLTILTGGDSEYFVEKLKKPIFANQNLVLIGLNHILDHNV
jgi:type III pantothenate kinase